MNSQNKMKKSKSTFDFQYLEDDEYIVNYNYKEKLFEFYETKELNFHYFYK